MPKTLLTPERLQRMIHVINEQRTWIIAQYNSKQIPYLRLKEDDIVATYSPSLDLKVSVAQGGYTKRQKWTIPICQLEKSVRKMMAEDRAFGHRVHNNFMTTYDIERLILDATYGVVNLELEDKMYNPNQLLL